ncbi:guanine nucleotide-binding protein subunit alpha PWA37_005066 [Arxiozyma heterogenica]|uniref:Guanine nucleotide-binding protein alpha-1 subunit n=1 Tax=Arxiozyma heterogenica TaxID=278026 RepID=A0AAN7WU62_9SACH|nr:hypothetical protein RI543_000405 [Kazachstania heterogenica]
MGCIASTSNNEFGQEENDPFLQFKKANDAIEQELYLEKQRKKNEIKLLLLGAGESGKSTVLKQLKLLHQGGFTHRERRQYSQVIWADAIESMKILIIQARKLNIPLDCDDPEKNEDLFKAKTVILNTNTLQLIDANLAGGSNFLNDYVLKYSERFETKRRIQSTGKVQTFDINPSSDGVDVIDVNEINETLSKDNNLDSNNGLIIGSLQSINNSNNNNNIRSNSSKNLEPKVYTNEDIANAIAKLWKNDKGIKQCFNRSNEFQLESSAAYYFDNIIKFAAKDYTCSDTDILMGRIKTTGITENLFNIGSTKFKVLDAGGQRSERKKWIHSFQNITAVIFVLATSEYDQMLFEDERVNRMHESIMLFDTLLNSKWFRNVPFILFLNKIDLFEQKVKRAPIRKYFPDYQGRMGDAETGLQYFEKLFLSLNCSNKPIYVKRTCATDSQTMKFVLSAVTDMIIQQNMKRSGLL